MLLYRHKSTLPNVGRVTARAAFQLSAPPVAVAPVSDGVTTSMPKDISRFVPGPDELFATFTVKFAVVVVHELSVNMAVAANVAPSRTVENTMVPVSPGLSNGISDACA